jgi:hypothetical protein
MAATCDELCSFTTSRRLQEPPFATDPSCEAVTIVQGWFTRAGDRHAILQVGATVTDCDGVELRTSSPFLLIVPEGRNFVVVREHGYEDESFEILELRGNRLEPQLEVRGGGC